ncbi:ABC transporter permease [Sanguibacter sp. HDW7]|uniref:ABC transporter permease n=1 Tax=Sanguibacter sp. HDW7 TaxID=2714931 RepID=UPI001409CEC3|nr:ABC transporter permease subunit [Sanguibacter sp. HDW7]QIK84022.1 ABC transporter permease subunit [Sanguibacter sp. HDW7]
MMRAVRLEVAKFFSTRMWWVLLILMGGYMALLAGGMGFAFTAAPESVSGGAGTGTPAADPLATARAVYAVGTTLGYVFPAIIGTLAVTGDLRHRTIVPTLLADPSRTRLLVAKHLGALPVGIAYGLVGSLAALGAGAALITLGGGDPMLGHPEVWRTVALSTVALTLWTLVGVGVGSAISNQVAALVVLLAFTQFVEPIARTGLTAGLGAAGTRIAQFLPGAAGDALAEGSIYSLMAPGTLAPWWQGALVLLGYAVILTVVGRLTTFRRDID